MKKQRVIIYGVGNNFIHSARWLFDATEVISIVDGDKEKQGRSYFGYEVKSWEAVCGYAYDYVIITPTQYDLIKRSLVNRGVPEHCLVPMDVFLPKSFYTCQLSKKHDGELRVAVLLNGGLGDILLGKTWLYHVCERYRLEYESVDLYAQIKDLETVESIYSTIIPSEQLHSLDYSRLELLPEENYDAVVWLCMIPAVVAWNRDYVMKANPELCRYLGRLVEYGQEHYCANLFASQRFHSMLKQYRNKRYFQFADVFDEFEIEEVIPTSCPIDIKNNTLSAFGLLNKRYITLNTGLNIEYYKKKNVRAWNFENWNKLACIIKREYPGILLVQLGMKKDTPEIGADINIAGRTNLEQLKVVLKHAFLHVDYEGGLVHLRHALNGGVSCVLFGPTPITCLNYVENIPVCTEACRACAWEWNDWLTTCHNEEHPYICMKSITPEMVFEKVKEYLDGNVQG